MGDQRAVPRGGAGIKVRVVKGANLAMERVDADHARLAARHLSTASRTSDTNYKRVLDWALTPERTDAVRLGVAGHNLFDLAFAWLLARAARGRVAASSSRCCSAWRPARPRPCGRDVGGLLLYTPVVHPSEFDVGDRAT